jgi:cellulose synthase/poly-beta-1,6-N-acetylglucosamine synthase-like glycosyltransferase
MESLLWVVRTHGSFALAAPLAKVCFILLILCWDYPYLVVRSFFRKVFKSTPKDSEAGVKALPILVVIPSLLRQQDELDSILSTLQSVSENGYPGDMTVVVSIDGTASHPALYRLLQQEAQKVLWCTSHRLFITGTEQRRSKPMAIEHGMEFVRGLVDKGTLPAFPPVYVSTDADADLGRDALKKIVFRLQRPNRFTGTLPRAVAGALHVRGNNFWQGYRHFFTVQGQLNLQVAREYYVGNIWRHNLRWMPITGVPGAFYCTWSEIFLQIPKYMTYMQTLKKRHWFAWWMGVAPPSFEECVLPPVPERMAGDTDDTVSAYVATVARYENGRFTLELPRTPLHSLWYLLRGIFVDRGLQYEPEAPVYTSSPTTLKTLFKQRKRWNSSRVELTGRFSRILGYHWTLGAPVTVLKLLLARSIMVGLAAYLLVPMFLWKSSLLTAFVFGYVGNVITFGMMTFFAVLINGDWHYWRMFLALPLAPMHQFVFNWIPGTVGIVSDVLLFGNRTGFSPETTLIKGGSSRIALLFRFRRAFLLSVRGTLKADVPFGSFWFGWRETPWTPNGFEGWTTGQAPRAILPPMKFHKVKVPFGSAEFPVLIWPKESAPSSEKHTPLS